MHELRREGWYRDVASYDTTLGSRNADRKVPEKNPSRRIVSLSIVKVSTWAVGRKAARQGVRIFANVLVV
jgi:hypothetical protein